MPTVFVDPALPGRRLRARCVARVEADVNAAGFARLLVPAALDAVGFYRRLGYELVGWGREELEPGVLLTYRRMQKTLSWVGHLEPGHGLRRGRLRESSTTPSVCR